jgi:NhaP-type Na+/H+ or K+/H+ antiporter
VLGVFLLVFVVLLWALVAGRLAKLSVTSALAVVFVGMVLTAGSHPVIRINLDTKIIERGVELTLAILLFADASVVPGSILRSERSVLTRLLVIGLPLSLVIAWLVGFRLALAP